MSLFNSLAINHELWSPLDSEGNTILHIAATRFSQQSVDVILSQSLNLGDIRKHMGETAMESVEEGMEQMRTKRKSDRFSGFNDRSIQILIR